MSLEVDSCCGCIKLRTGSLIIGYLYLFFQVCTIIISCFAIAFGTYLEESDVEDDEVLGIIITIIFSILLIIELWGALFTILLLVGVHKNKRGLVKTYLVYAGIFLILSVISNIIRISTGYTEIYYLAFEFCDIVLGTYYYIVIRSHYHQMEGDDMKLPAIYNSH